MSSTTLRKWGNGQGILVPKSYTEILNLKPGDKMNISLTGDTITLRPEKYVTLSSLMEGYDGPPPEEYDWGNPKGKEMW